MLAIGSFYFPNSINRFVFVVNTVLFCAVGPDCVYITQAHCSLQSTKSNDGLAADCAAR